MSTGGRSGAADWNFSPRVACPVLQSPCLSLHTVLTPRSRHVVVSFGPQCVPPVREKKDKGRGREGARTRGIARGGRKRGGEERERNGRKEGERAKEIEEREKIVACGHIVDGIW